MSGPILSSDGSTGPTATHRDEREYHERGAEHYGPHSGGKKRKVPAFHLPAGRVSDDQHTWSPGKRGEHPEDAAAEGDTKVDASAPRAATVSAITTTAVDGDPDQRIQRTITYPLSSRCSTSPAAHSRAFHKALFLRRKAALITLYLDAQNVIIANHTNHINNLKSSINSAPRSSSSYLSKNDIPDVPTFEALLPALEGLGVSEWAADKPGWRNSWTDYKKPEHKSLELWRTKYDQKQRVRASRKPMERRGWAPEGSFEFEMETKASTSIRSKLKDRAALNRLATELRNLVLSSPKPPAKPAVTSNTEGKPPAKTQRRLAVKDKEEEPVPLSKTTSLESDGVPGTKKKSKKKKKRSVLANQGNPHHVDNYRPSRVVSNIGDPYEPYPHHASLLFPPPMRLLATRPQRKTAPLPGTAPANQPVRPAEDDYICCFCEVQLFFGTEAARRRAIRRLKAERKRKDNIRTKARDVADGKGKLKTGDGGDESEYDDEEDWCDDDDGYGRCTCGRRVNEPHRSGKSRLKPPETDPPDGHYHDHDHDHDHHHDHHHHHQHDHDHDHDHDYDYDDLDDHHDHHTCCGHDHSHDEEHRFVEGYDPNAPPHGNFVDEVD